jgi:hypothetical protein
MSGTRRVPLARRATAQISARAVELFRDLERANRARKRAIDCTISEFGRCTADCRACRRWADAHDDLHSELKLPPWFWPCLPHNPYPPGSPRARAWEAAEAPEEQLELQVLLQEAVRRARSAAKPADAPEQADDERAPNAEPAGQDTTST